MIFDNIKAKGSLRIVLTGPDGSVKTEKNVNNLVVTTGKNWLAGRMSNTDIPNQMSHMAVGDGTTAANVSDTTLENEAGRAAISTTTVSTNTTQYITTFGAGTGTGALTEAGIFNAASAGTMLCRTVFSVINKGADDTLAITWTITIN
jgi:hypothetical protein